MGEWITLNDHPTIGCGWWAFSVRLDRESPTALARLTALSPLMTFTLLFSAPAVSRAVACTGFEVGPCRSNPNLPFPSCVILGKPLHGSQFRDPGEVEKVCWVL